MLDFRQRVSRLHQVYRLRSVPVDGRQTVLETVLGLGTGERQAAISGGEYCGAPDRRLDLQQHDVHALVHEPAGQRRRQRGLRQHLAGEELPLERPTLRDCTLLRLRKSQCVNDRCPRMLYILCWSELSRRRLGLLPAVSPAAGHLTTPTVAGLPGLSENLRPTTSKSSPI